jgi:glutaminyl-peptide cyclotransferase
MVASYPHDPAAFTQGLVWHEGHLYESTGLYGASSVRQVRLEDGLVLMQQDLPDDLFGEGLALVDDRLVQLTWQAGDAYVWSLDAFDRALERFNYSGEGWGLCFDGARLVMSDGSDRLTFRDAQTFEVIGGVDVTFEGRPLERLNELECVGDRVWANVWFEDRIVEIDPSTGRVVSYAELGGLLSGEERSRLGRDDVLNGIAYRPGTGHFLVTGKRWPKVFEIDLR